MGYPMPQQKSRYQIFLENCAQDVFFYGFFLVFLSVLRVAFLAEFRGALLSTTTAADILGTLWYGLRISLKTVGAITLIPFVLGTLVQTVYRRWPARQIRLYWGLLCCVGFALLFQTRIAYYKEFQQAFSPFLFNTFHDDVRAIVQTAIDQYNAVARVGIALLIAAGNGALLWLGLKHAPKAAAPLLRVQKKGWVIAGIVVFILAFAPFARWGGSWGYRHSIYWKNAARMNQHLLNETIYDDVQALYRAHKLHTQLQQATRNLTAEDVRQAISRLTGQPYTEDSLLPFFTQTANGPQVAKPSHIFLIVAETYMQWPLLEKYDFLPVTNGLKSLIARPDSIYFSTFLPAANGTMFGLTSVLLGLPELNLYTANQPTAQEPYETALSVQLKKLGYKTRFFYGGFASWENVSLFMPAQDVDESHYYADFGSKGGVWGVHDKELFAGVEKFVTQQPSFNVILTGTNHPPYTVNMHTEPTLTSAEKLRELLPENTPDKEMMVERLQHFEYADKYLTQFVQTMLAKYPDSLFIITGDHADRYTLTPNPSLYERLSVPLVILGKGINKQLAQQPLYGAHMDIAATVLNLVTPQGETYYALGQDLLQPHRPGLHMSYFITDRILADLNSDGVELLPGQTEKPADPEIEHAKAQLKDVQTVAAWRILHGVWLQ